MDNFGTGSNPFREPDDQSVDFPVVRPHRVETEHATEDLGRIQTQSHAHWHRPDPGLKPPVGPLSIRSVSRRSPWLSGPLKIIVPLIILILIVTLVLLISRCGQDEPVETEQTTVATTIQVTTVTTEPPRQVLTIQDGHHYNIRPSPDLTGAPVFSTAGGETFTVLESVTGAATDFGDTWYVIEYDGQTAYLIADEAGQTLGTESP